MVISGGQLSSHSPLPANAVFVFLPLKSGPLGFFLSTRLSNQPPGLFDTSSHAAVSSDLLELAPAALRGPPPVLNVGFFTSGVSGSDGTTLPSTSSYGTFSSPKTWAAANAAHRLTAASVSSIVASNPTGTWM